MKTSIKLKNSSVSFRALHKAGSQKIPKNNLTGGETHLQEKSHRVQYRNRAVGNAAFFPPEGVCLHVIDFYLSLDGLIHRFNYIMYCPINTALQLFYIQPGCQIELNGFLKAYKAGKYLSLVGIFLHIGY